MSNSTRIDTDPGAPVPQEELDKIPSIFVDRTKLKALCDEVSKMDEKNLDYASEHVIRGVIHLAALSIPNKVISRSLHIPVTRVESIVNSSTASAEITRIQIDHYNRDADHMFKRLVPAAVQNIFEIMVERAGKTSVRLDAAKYITDRALGKPKEILETKNDMLAQVFGALQEKKNNASQEQPIEAEFESLTPDDSVKKDPLEEILGDSDDT